MAAKAEQSQGLTEGASFPVFESWGDAYIDLVSKDKPRVRGLIQGVDVTITRLLTTYRFEDSVYHVQSLHPHEQADHIQTMLAQNELEGTLPHEAIVAVVWQQLEFFEGLKM